MVEYALKGVSSRSLDDTRDAATATTFRDFIIDDNDDDDGDVGHPRLSYRYVYVIAT